MSRQANPTAAAPIKLDRLQQLLLKPRIEPFFAAASDEAGRAPWRELAAALERMEIPFELAERLAALLEVVLSDGRVRREVSPGAETSLAALYRSTPRGRKIADSVKALNIALGELKGHTIESVGASLRGPGAYAVTLRTETLQIAILFQASGVSVESIEVGLE